MKHAKHRKAEEAQLDELARAIRDVERREYNEQLQRAIAKRRNELRSIQNLMGAGNRDIF